MAGIQAAAPVSFRVRVSDELVVYFFMYQSRILSLIALNSNLYRFKPIPDMHDQKTKERLIYIISKFS